MTSRLVVVIGGAGQLGTDIVAAFRRHGDQVLLPTHGELDMCDQSAVETFFRASRPDVVINTAAVHDLRVCEDDPGSATAKNVSGPTHLSEAAGAVGAYFVHFSTDYVFDGLKRQPYVEEDACNPLNAYGMSKWLGEQSVLAVNAASAVVRVSALFGHAPCRGKAGHNFIERMLASAQSGQGLRVVDDEIVSPTSTSAIAGQILALVDARPAGVIHSTSEGSCSWFEFTCEILRQSGIDAEVEPVPASTFPSMFARPAYSVLENRVLRNLDLDRMPHWRDGLALYLEAKR